MLEQIQEEPFDIGLGAWSPLFPDLAAHLNIKPIIEGKISVCCSADDTLAVVPLDVLENKPFVLVLPGYLINEIVDQIMTPRLDHLAIIYDTDNTESARMIVAQNRGVT